MFSLLGRTDMAEEKNAGDTDLPAFFIDLNLDQILDRVCEGWGDKVRKLYGFFPATKEDEEYRRAVYTDIKKDGVREALELYYRSIRERFAYASRREAAVERIQKHVWYLREVNTYICSLGKLSEELDRQEPASEGMKGLLAYLKECISAESFKNIKSVTAELWKELASFRVVLTYEKERFTIAEGKGEGGYEAFLKESFPDVKRDYLSPFTDTEGYSSLEEEIVKLFRKKHRSFFKRLEAFCTEYPVYLNEGIAGIENEMLYYLAYAQFQKKMSEKGFNMCTPKASKDKLTATALYDLALALTNMENGREVVPNKVYLAEDEKFFVLTGPNQGGKTTYGRSLGQLVYLTKMGLDVPADSASVPYYTNLWTHFSVEESAETGRGKLMDELVRLKPIMKDEQKGAFVVINELFTTAANFDAIEMGRRVLKYLTDRSCKGIYVTHLGELSASCPGVVSLRAMLDEDHVQTFRIERSEAVEDTGINRQVLKYRLTYEQIKERFS